MLQVDAYDACVFFLVGYRECEERFVAGLCDCGGMIAVFTGVGSVARFCYL